MELTYDYIKKERAKYLALADLLISGWDDINTMPALNRIEATEHFYKSTDDANLFGLPIRHKTRHKRCTFHR